LNISPLCIATKLNIILNRDRRDKPMLRRSRTSPTHFISKI
jgi:hypothetical protein